MPTAMGRSAYANDRPKQPRPERGVREGLSCMRGNSHVQFLGGGEVSNTSLLPGFVSHARRPGRGKPRTSTGSPGLIRGEVCGRGNRCRSAFSGPRSSHDSSGWPHRGVFSDLDGPSPWNPTSPTSPTEPSPESFRAKPTRIAPNEPGASPLAERTRHAALRYHAPMNVSANCPSCRREAQTLEEANPPHRRRSRSAPGKAKPRRAGRAKPNPPRTSEANLAP